jgi:hypothetical protein
MTMTTPTVWTVDTLADAMDEAPRSGSSILDDAVVQCPKCRTFIAESRTGSHAATCAALRADTTTTEDTTR